MLSSLSPGVKYLEIKVHIQINADLFFCDKKNVKACRKERNEAPLTSHTKGVYKW